jgi:NTP pyrophosphatase (non-canonical NTP hydrolase)
MQVSDLPELTIEELELVIQGIAENWDLYAQSDAKSQVLKTVSEVGELCDNVNKGRYSEAKDDIGDIVVTLVNLCKFLDLSLQECIVEAVSEIWFRKGKIINGTFVKESDLKADE